MSSRPVVLLAEDDPDIALLVAEALEMEGYSVVQARHGRQALGLLDVTRPALVLTDLMMPEMDGFALIRELSARAAPRPPVLAMSAFESYLPKALELGASGALAKPFGVEELLRHVRSIATEGVGAPRATPLDVDESDRLSAIAEMQLDHPSPSPALQAFTERTARLFDVPICLVSIVTRDAQRWHAFCGLPSDLAAARGTPRGDSFCTHAVAAEAALVVIDTHENPFFHDNVLVRERGLRFYAGVPLVYRRGEPLGTLCLLAFEPRPFTVFDLELMGVLSRRVVGEFEWRERRAHPELPLSAFRHLAAIDEELDVLGREAFEHALEVESRRAARQRAAAALVVIDCDRIAHAVEALKAEFPRALLGRLGLRRVGLITREAGAGSVEARARAVIGEDAVFAGADVASIAGGACAALRQAEGTRR